MPYVPEILEQYKECEKALKDAERLFEGVLEGEMAERIDPRTATMLENVLLPTNDAMAMIKGHREYGPKLETVLKKLDMFREKKSMQQKKLIEDSRKRGLAQWPSEPGLAPMNSPLVEPVADAELLSGNWASCVSQAKTKNLEVATARQIAELRIKHGKDSKYCTSGSWIGDSFNYLPDGRILVALRDYNNPLLKYSEEATKAHIAGKEYYLDDEAIGRLFESERKGDALLLERKDIINPIPVDAFGNEPLTFFLGWWNDYGHFLKDCGISEIKVHVCNEKYAKKQNRAFSRAVWLDGLNLSSAINGNDDFLINYCGRAFGVRSASPVGRSGLRSGADAERQNRGEHSGTGSTGPR